MSHICQLRQDTSMKLDLFPAAIDTQARATIDEIGGGSASDEEVLGGPGCDDLDIDPVFGQVSQDVYDDLAADIVNSNPDLAGLSATDLITDPTRAGGDLYAVAEDAEGTRFEIRVIGSSVILAVAHPEDGKPALAGFYAGASLVVEDDYSGRGIGTALAGWMFIMRGGFPCWDLDEAAYSPKGESAHLSAYARLCIRPVIPTLTPIESPSEPARGMGR
jgi:GNAT superfamily N-acetyltransferase